MIDIHSHILPNVDDGAQTLNDSLAMARAAVKQGIDTIIATPHHQNGHFNNTKAAITEYVRDLNDELTRAGIPLTVLPGQESRIHSEMVGGLLQGDIMPLNETTPYVFVEFPSSHVPRYSEQLFFDIQVEGYIPVIVHPERNREIMEHPDALQHLIEHGALSQVTAACLSGRFGKKRQKLSHQLIDANLAHFLASDAHNTTSRGFCLQEAYETLDKEHGADIKAAFTENCELLVNGETVNRLQPEPIKKHSFLGLFK